MTHVMGDSHEGAPGEPSASDGGTGAPPAPGAPNRAPDLTREYSTSEITVQWYASRCIHSANCVRALIPVFDPRRRPWVDPAAASADEIAAAVRLCPTGALHYVRHDGGVPETPDVPTTVTPVPNGPLYVRGDVEMRGLDGTVLRHDTRLALCRCGLTRNVPRCDNTCRSAGWEEPAVTPRVG